MWRPPVTLPRVFWDRELPEMELRLEQLRNLGVETACAGTLAGVRLAQRLGFRCGAISALRCTMPRPSRS